MSELEHIASLLERLVESNQVLCEAIATLEQKVAGQKQERIDKAAAAELLHCSPRTLERYRQHWVEGVHYFRQGKGHIYNRVLLEDWQINRFDPRAHERAIAHWSKKQAKN